jgi:alpha-beta hydrolase superfamily lysophospholipase
VVIIYAYFYGLGFGDHTQNFMMDFAIRLCNDGYVVFMMDAEGHGLSDGLHGCIHDFNAVVRDLSDFFLDSLHSHQLLDKPFFLYGVSMGGALAFNLSTIPSCREIQRHISGVILSAPMVKISDELKPPRLVVEAMKWIAKFIPLAPVTPIEDILDKCFKVDQQKLRARNHCLQYNLKPRLQTSIVMLQTTDDISARLKDLSHPVLIVHGGADVVTCPELSKSLYKMCTSKDKMLKIYPGCVHDLLNGEEQEQVDVIYNDMLQWMNQRLG